MKVVVEDYVGLAYLFIYLNFRHKACGVTNVMWIAFALRVGNAKKMINDCNNGHKNSTEKQDACKK